MKRLNVGNINDHAPYFVAYDMDNLKESYAVEWPEVVYDEHAIISVLTSFFFRHPHHSCVSSVI